jgi:hypothetical protein
MLISSLAKEVSAVAAPVKRQPSGPDSAGAHATENPDLHLYERAMELFKARNFQPAREYFLTLTNSANPNWAYSAGLRAKMCNRRLGNV